jgi:membrane-associated phospholipid phosphatase
MKKYFFYLLVALFVFESVVAQDTTVVSKDTLVSINEPVATDSIAVQAFPSKKEPVYKIKPWIDIPVTAVTTGISLMGFSKIYSKDRLTMEELSSLDRNNVPRFDRSALDKFNEKFSKVGDYFFYGSMPLPVLFLFDKKTRKDFPKLALLYLEAMGATGVPYVSAVYFGDRYRPYAYNPEVPIDFRMRGGARNSFFAGHPALVATSTFFMATVFSDYYPNSKSKWLFYTLAGAATATTALARYHGGRHFPSDILIGITLGPLSGILIPKIHKNKDLSKRKTAVTPFFGESSGLVLTHKF